MFKYCIKKIESNRLSKNLAWSFLVLLKDNYFKGLNNTASFLYKIFLRKKFSKPPIFIGGCGRSGTTLLLSILSAHSDILAIPHETNAFVKKPERLYKIYFYLLGRYFKIGNRNRWMEKTPRNIENLEKMSKIFGNNFKFINIVRDGRDVILSKHPLRKGKYWVEGDRWIKDVEVGKALEDKDNFITIKYEDIILDYDKTIKHLCNFLEIPLTEELDNWYKFTTVTTNKAWDSSVKPIFSKSIGKWKDPQYKEKIKGFISKDRARSLLDYYKYDE